MELLALGLAFILELIAFIGFAALGLLVPVPRLAQLGLSAVLLIGLMLFWGAYMAPRAPKPLPTREYYIVKLFIYSLAAGMLYRLYGPDTGIFFAAAVILNELALYKHNAERTGRAN